MNETVLKMDSVVKRFGDNEVLRGVSLELRRHEVVCLIGASGSGKSTLLRCVNLLERIDGGDISLYGQSLTDPRIDPNMVRRHIGIVFQSFNLFPHLSVLDNVVLGPVRAHKRKRDEVREEAMVLLERIGLKERANEYPERLSGGQQQRVAIVRSLAMRPALLLLDEVTSALDPTLVGEVLDLLTDLAHQGTTMLIATHEMNFARDVANEVAYLDKGVLVEKGTPDQIFTAPREESTKNFLSRVR
jgi:polar amino acid transport system ATP-binding protein